MPGSGCSSTKGSIGLSAGISTGMGGVSTPGGGGGGGGTSGGAGGTVCGAMAEAECSVALMMGLPIRLIFKAVNKRADPGRSKRREANWLPGKNLVWDGVGFDRPRLLSHVGQQPGRASVWKTTAWRNIAAALESVDCALRHGSSAVLAASSGRHFFHMRLAGVQKVNDGLAVVQVLGAFCQFYPVARAR